jgi:hypothetical protein
VFAASTLPKLDHLQLVKSKGFIKATKNIRNLKEIFGPYYILR